MTPVSINPLAFILASAVPMVVGFIWYSPQVFGKAWMKAAGLDKLSKKQINEGMGTTMGINILFALVTSYVLTHLLNFLQVTTIPMAIQASFWIWLGFIASTQVSDALFNKRPTNFILINISYRLVTIITMSVVLTLF